MTVTGLVKQMVESSTIGGQLKMLYTQQSRNINTAS